VLLQFVIISQLIEVCFIDVPRGIRYVVDKVQETHAIDLLMVHSNTAMRYLVSR
jgi:hypothetical protein